MALSIGIPGVVRVDADADAFVSGATVAVTAPPAPQGQPGVGDYTIIAGAPVTITFPAGALLKPITLTFDVTPPPDTDWQAVSMHQLNDGTWEPILGTYDGRGHLTVITDSFSIHVPSFLNPKRLFDGLVRAATSFFGGRTDPGPCPPNVQPPAPAWLTVTGPLTGATHICTFDNSDGKGERIEVQLRSNRGVYLVVNNPANADYAFSDFRSRIITNAGHRYHLIADNESIIAPGDLMTFGVRRAATRVVTSVNVHTNNQMILMSGLAAFFGDVAGPLSFLECIIDPGSLELVLKAFADLLSCGVSVMSDLANGDTALAAVRDASGNTIDQATLDDQAELLVSQADKFKGLGRIFALIGVAQAVFPLWTQMLDAADELTIAGAGDVNVTLDPPPPAPSAGQCPDVTNVGSNQNRATDITATGLTCAKAEDLIRAVVSVEEDIGRTTSVAADGFDCTIEQTPDEASIIEDYVCSADVRFLTWQVYYGE